MLSASRKVAFILLAALAIVATGCGSSNNKGKIVGKWKITGGGGIKEDQAKMMEALGVAAYIEFREDGTAAFGMQANNPEFQKALDSKEKTSASFKYKLLSGDVVEFYDLPKDSGEKSNNPFGSKDREKATIKIDGDNMTISDDDKLKADPLKLTKMK
jgi:hypothetical protein